MTTPDPKTLPLRNRLLDDCWEAGSADANVVIQAVIDVLLISIVAASRDADACERNVRAIADDMISNARRAHEEFHAMHEGLKATRQ